MPISLMWVLVGALMFTWLVLIVAAAWLAVTRPGHHPTVPTDRGRVILTDRFARGEIDAEEFRERLGNPRETVSRRSQRAADTATAVPGFGDGPITSLVRPTDRRWPEGRRSRSAAVRAGPHPSDDRDRRVRLREAHGYNVDRLDHERAAPQSGVSTGVVAPGAARRRAPDRRR